MKTLEKICLLLGAPLHKGYTHPTPIWEPLRWRVTSRQCRSQPKIWRGGKKFWGKNVWF